MIRPELIRDIEVLAGIELVYANQKFPAFASPHEGYAVLKEEIEETMDEADYLKCLIRAIWCGTRQNADVMTSILDLEIHALDCAAEAIQVVAMCKKYLDSLGGERLNDKQ